MFGKSKAAKDEAMAAIEASLVSNESERVREEMGGTYILLLDIFCNGFCMGFCT